MIKEMRLVKVDDEPILEDILLMVKKEGYPAKLGHFLYNSYIEKPEPIERRIDYINDCPIKHLTWDDIKVSDFIYIFLTTTDSILRIMLTKNLKDLNVLGECKI